MDDEKITGVEESEIEEVEAVSEETVSSEEVICEDAVVEEECIPEIDGEVTVEAKKSGNKGLVINAILTGILLIGLIVNLVVSIGNSKKIKAVEADLADVKEVLSYALTGDPYTSFDFAEIAGEIREQRKMMEDIMKELENQQKTEEAPADNK